MANKVIFSIQTQLEMEGRQLKGLTPNKDGVFTGIPLTVLGTHSRNMVNYDKSSMLQCITDPHSNIAQAVTEGNLEGEWGHPMLDNDKSINRLLRIERTLVSHRIIKLYGVDDPSTGLTIVYGDIKPYGPYGKYLKDSFEDPTINTAFSLRSAAIKTSVQDGITYKRVLALVTFDAVGTPGFLRASKRYRDINALESLDNSKAIEQIVKDGDVEIEVTKDQFMKARESVTKEAGLETIITDQRVLDAFCCDKVTVKDTVLSRSNGCFFDGGKKVSIFDKCFSMI